MTRPKVAVIGAGASGLAALKQCLEENLDVVCFDQEPQVGGLWRYVPQSSSLPNGGTGAGGEEVGDVHSSVYMSTIINTSKEMMSYSDFPAPDDWPTYLPHRFVVKYLNLYCDKFDLRKNIKFNRKVVSLTQEVDTHGKTTGRWEVVTQKSTLKSRCETFDYVIVATGHHWKPRLPDFPGVETFRGTMMHSHSYKVPYPFKDQRVLVIGVGNSGADIATELSHHAKQVILSARSGTWILPRFSLFGIPLDHLSSRAAHALPRPITNFAFETLMRLQHGDMGRFGLKPEHRIFEAHPTINGHVLDRIATGKVLVRPNIQSFAPGNIVHFDDGTSEQIDAVVYCTGYRIEHPFLDNALEVLGQERADSNRVRLYKNIFPPNHANISFVGMVQPIGAVMPVAEMQARYVSRVISGDIPLPPPKKLRDLIDMEWQLHAARYVPKERHTIEVEYVTYMDDLASQIGCKPDMWRLIVRNREIVLALQLLFGPAVPSQYRLDGPGQWKGAKEAIGKACEGLDFRNVVGYKAVEKLRVSTSSETSLANSVVDLSLAEDLPPALPPR
ncbi:flavin monooxygenase-like protein [Phlyctochytrium arcticum]|nr:flavin monooxygenase-like protein [Phlyctochytrium arcticum]